MKKRVWVTGKERLEERINCDCCGKSLLIAQYLSNGDTVGSECAEEIVMNLGRMRYGLELFPRTLPAVLEYINKLQGVM